MPLITESTDHAPTPPNHPMNRIVKVQATPTNSNLSDKVKSLAVANEAAAPVSGVTPEAPQTTSAESDPRLSPRFLALARAQKEQRRKDEELKRREEALKAKEQSYEKDYIPKSKLQGDGVLDTLEELGLTYDQLVTIAMNRTQTPVAPEVKQLLSRVDELDNTLKDRDAKAQEQQTKAYNDAIESLRKEATALVESDPQFDTIKQSGNLDAVVELIETRWREEGGTPLTVAEAAKEVEDYLVEEAMRVVSYSKIKARLNPSTEEGLPPVNGTQPTPPKKFEEAVANRPEPTRVATAAQPIKTITNAATSALSRPARSSREREERARLAFMGQLKD